MLLVSRQVVGRFRSYSSLVLVRRLFHAAKKRRYFYFYFHFAFKGKQREKFDQGKRESRRYGALAEEAAVGTDGGKNGSDGNVPVDTLGSSGLGRSEWS